MGERGEVFSSKIVTEKRSYFFNVKENRRGELYLNVVESKQQGFSGFERQSILVFPEDLDNFKVELLKAIDFMKQRKPKVFKVKSSPGKED